MGLRTLWIVTLGDSVFPILGELSLESRVLEALANAELRIIPFS
jgi:hypothetical protein